ncbi:MAG: branched-chain amino acid ABC transporter permease [Actinomycetota bacterium]|nr:branched-chain amino acid ABC transporter permease [Actinomycetota bacterium]MDQ2956994.1 branched-chain amino acid ABC transporter permease [Actinomycetota bacterium]
MSTTERPTRDVTLPATESALPARGRLRQARLPLLVAAIAVFVALLPQLQLSLPGVLPGPTWTPGSLQLLAVCLLIGALAVTYNLVFAVTGMLSFGHALYFALGCYVFAMLLEHARLAILPAALLTLLIGSATALLIGLVSLRVTGIAFAMVTLAFAQAGSVLALRNVHGLTGGEEGLGLPSARLPASLVGVDNTQNLYWISLAVAVTVLAAVGWIVASRAGHLMLAVRDNELRVQALGIRPYLVRLMSFTASGCLATLIGMAYLLVQGGASPQITTSSFTLTLLVMVVLGGLGSRWGAMLGGVIYTLLDQRLAVLASSSQVAGLARPLRVPLSQPTFLLGVLFVVVVLFLPGGLTGTIARLRGRFDRAPLAELSQQEAR